MKHTIYILAATAVLFACTKEEYKEESRLMTINFSTTQMDATTRGTLIGNETELRSTTVGLKIYNSSNVESNTPTETKYVTSKWTVTDYYWNPSKTLDIFAYAPKTVSTVTMGTPNVNNSDVSHVMTFTYSIPNTATPSQMPDIMAAHTNQSGLSGTSVNLSLYHTLSAVRFKTGTSVCPMDITKLSLIGIRGSETCTFTGSASPNPPTISWTSTGGTVTYDFSTTLSVGLNESKYINTDANTFVLIPQTLGSSAKVELFFTPTGRTAISPECSISGTWEPGKIYTYELNYQEGILSIGDITVQAWTDASLTDAQKKLTLN